MTTNLFFAPTQTIYHNEETSWYGNKYFYNCEGKTIDLSLATSLYVDFMPKTSYFWPCVRIETSYYYLTYAMDSEDRAMVFLKSIANKINN